MCLLRRAVTSLLFALGLPWVAAAQITVPYTFVLGTVANPTEVNANFAKLQDALNRTGGTMTGSVVFSPDNTLDIGASGSQRPRRLYIGTEIVSPLITATTGNFSGNVSVGGNLTVTGTLITGGGASIDASNIADGSVNNTEFQYLNNARSELQAQIDGIIAGVSAVPSGMVAFFASGSCPSGWSSYNEGQGRLIVGLVAGGTLQGTSGSALTNLQAMTSAHTHGTPNHTHATNADGAHVHDTTSTTGSHNHFAATSRFNATHTHTFSQSTTTSTPSAVTDETYGTTATFSMATDNHTHGVSISGTTSSNTGSLDHEHGITAQGDHAHSVTNTGSAHSHTTTSSGAGTTGAASATLSVPYLQLLACKKD